MRRARAGEPDHDDRRGELDLEDLGAPAHEVFDEQPGREQPDRALVDREPAERAETGVGLDRGDHRVEPGRKPGSPKSSHRARSRARRRAARRRRSGCRASRRSRARRAAPASRRGSRRSSMRIVVGHGASRRSSRFVALRTSPSSQRVSQKFARPCSASSCSCARAVRVERAAVLARRPRARARRAAPR